MKTKDNLPPTLYSAYLTISLLSNVTLFKIQGTLQHLINIIHKLKAEALHFIQNTPKSFEMKN